MLIIVVAAPQWHVLWKEACAKSMCKPKRAEPQDHVRVLSLNDNRCGRANRPDAAVKVVAALRKDGIKPTSAMSNTYFKAKKVCVDGYSRVYMVLSV